MPAFQALGRGAKSPSAWAPISRASRRGGAAPAERRRAGSSSRSQLRRPQEDTHARAHARTLRMDPPPPGGLAAGVVRLRQKDAPREAAGSASFGCRAVAPGRRRGSPRSAPQSPGKDDLLVTAGFRIGGVGGEGSLCLWRTRRCLGCPPPQPRGGPFRPAGRARLPTPGRSACAPFPRSDPRKVGPASRAGSALNPGTPRVPTTA